MSYFWCIKNCIASHFLCIRQFSILCFAAVHNVPLECKGQKINSLIFFSFIFFAPSQISWPIIHFVRPFILMPKYLSSNNFFLLLVKMNIHTFLRSYWQPFERVDCSFFMIRFVPCHHQGKTQPKKSKIIFVFFSLFSAFCLFQLFTLSDILVDGTKDNAHICTEQAKCECTVNDDDDDERMKRNERSGQNNKCREVGKNIHEKWGTTERKTKGENVKLNEVNEIIMRLVVSFMHCKWHFHHRMMWNFQLKLWKYIFTRQIDFSSWKFRLPLGFVARFFHLPWQNIS